MSDKSNIWSRKRGNEIQDYFNQQSQTVFTIAELSQLFEKKHFQWGLPGGTTINKIADLLTAQHVLNKADIVFEDDRKVRLFTYGNASIYELAAAIHPGAYISHYPAMHLLGLTTQVPKTIYVTYEQSAKKPRDSSLTQVAIASAFAKPQRRSATEAAYGDYRIVVINGMHTGNKGTQLMPAAEGFFLCTTLERTLIDIVVRPNYAGGAFMVLDAYKNALEQNLSVNKLSALLQKLSFVYPYHQSIGFYLEKAGYSGSALDLFHRQPMPFDFYLDYQMEDPAYSKDWKLYYPKGM